MRDRPFFGFPSRSFLAVIFVAILVFSGSGAAAAFKNIQVGDQALPVELEDLDGNPRSLADLESSEAVLLFFWASWSQRALAELEDLAGIQEAYGDKGLAIMTINVENQDIGTEDLTRIRTLLEEKGLDLTVLVDQGLKTYNEWGVIATPTTAVIDKSGTVVFDMSSYPTSGYLEIEEAVQKVLGLFVEPAETAADAQTAYQPTKEAMLHFGLGKRHLEKGFVSKAIPELEKAAVADSRFVDPVIYLGYAHLRDGNPAAAGEQIDSALAMDPGRREARLLKAHLLLKEQNLDDAADLLQTGVSTAEAGTDTATDEDAAGTGEPLPEWLARALALREEGKTEDAIKALDEHVTAGLEEAGIVLEKKRKLSAMEKMKLMMQKQGTGQ